MRVRLVGEPHDGRELFIDELDLPSEIYTAAPPHPFEWWPARLHDAMKSASVGSDPASLPVLYVLRVPDDTREPLYVSGVEAR